MTFAWQATKDGRVRIAWRGRVVTTLAGADADRFLRQAEGADEDAAQLLMARVTGNFKRGNERPSSHEPGGAGPAGTGDNRRG